jgi:hypothetical protein
MSQVLISPAVLDLPRAIDAAFADAQDDIAEVLAKGWRTNIIALDVIDSRTYLESVDVADPIQVGRVRTVAIEAPEAGGYASAIKRKADSDYVGQRVAENAVEQSDGHVNAALDRAGDRLK